MDDFQSSVLTLYRSSDFACLTLFSSSELSSFRFPEPVDVGVNAGCARLLTGFFLRTRFVKSWAPCDASSILALCDSGDSPSIDSRIPLNGAAPFNGPFSLESLMDTGGWRSSTNYAIINM